MKRKTTHLYWLIGFFIIYSGTAFGQWITQDLVCVPADIEFNRVTITVEASGFSDTQSTDVSGTIQTTAYLNIDPVTPENAHVSQVRFNGGRLNLTDMAYQLGWGILSVYIDTQNLSGFVQTPEAPALVTGGLFDLVDHVVIIDQGTVNVSGLASYVYDFGLEPATAGYEGTGQIELSLVESQPTVMTYDITLTVPFEFDETNEDLGLAVRSYGSGILKATAQVIVDLCLADIAGNDCAVTMEDLEVFIDQWLAYDPSGWQLTADLAYQDGQVDLADFSILASRWLFAPFAD